LADAPLGRLKYLYVGSGDFDADLRYYRDLLGGALVWGFRRFGARVAALRLAEGPLLLLADHRPPRSCLPVFVVGDLAAALAALKARGWAPSRGPFEIPDGPCYVFQDPTGNEMALVGDSRPDALSAAYDPDDDAAIK
jgi:predicted enzyme related to lactoylglutathione lyase